MTVNINISLLKIQAKENCWYCKKKKKIGGLKKARDNRAVFSPLEADTACEYIFVFVCVCVGVWRVII